MAWVAGNFERECRQQKIVQLKGIFGCIMLLCSAKRVEVCCFVGRRVMCVAALIINVPVPVPLLPDTL